jgi:hypothetical protein
MLATAAQIASYIYPDSEDPAGAFSWWLSPCGGTDLVPDEVKEVFETLNSIADGISSFKPPRNIPRGSGQKGDDGNPNDQSTPRAPTSGSGGNKPKCNIPPSKRMTRQLGGKNMIRVLECVKDETRTTEYIVTSLISAQGATPSQVKRKCEAKYGHACYHYSSAIRVNNQWAALTCPPEAATSSKIRDKDSPAVKTWSAEHKGAGWKPDNCDRDEFPPAYFLNEHMVEWYAGGEASNGQLVRLLFNKQNQAAGNGMWRNLCFKEPLGALSDRVIRDRVAAARISSTTIDGRTKTQTYAAITIDQWPEMTITAWHQDGKQVYDDGLWDNSCWPRAKTPQDPGFALLNVDPWNVANNPRRDQSWPQNKGQPPYEYDAEYQAGQNGV